MILGKRVSAAVGIALAGGLALAPVSAFAENSFERLVIQLLGSQHEYEDFERNETPDWVGELRRPNQNRQVDTTFQLEAGVTYRIVGACDSDCTNMDMEVFDATGAKAGENLAFDDHPYVELTPTAAGVYRVHPWVVECNHSPCYGGVRVLKRQPAQRSGTAFLISRSGYLLTAAHVVERREKITIYTSTGEVQARVVARDPANDVAVLKAEMTGTPLWVTSAGTLGRGQEIMTLGYPLVQMQGESQKASFGRVNALSGLEDDVRYVQMDATIQPGNSGGPLLNAAGQVVGIVTATINQRTVMAAAGTVAQNVNYALKMDYALPLLPPEARPTGAPPAPAHGFEETAARAEPSVYRITAE
jgi:S1-C subfamily serine protease